ncbi:MAG: Sjogren's syndrome/scleroderma autoantigen 1 family protein [Archaeoglobaceae archaeon]
MSNKKISDESIIDAAQLLRKGAKMLSYYCPECKFPLFEAENKIFCPNCEREVKIEKKEETSGEIIEKGERKILDEKSGLIFTKLESAISKVCDLILQANSAGDVKALSESLEKLVSILERVKKL